MTATNTTTTTAAMTIRAAEWHKVYSCEPLFCFLLFRLFTVLLFALLLDEQQITDEPDELINRASQNIHAYLYIWVSFVQRIVLVYYSLFVNTMNLVKQFEWHFDCYYNYCCCAVCARHASRWVQRIVCTLHGREILVSTFHIKISWKP